MLLEVRVGEGCLKVGFSYTNLFSLRILVYSKSKYVLQEGGVKEKVICSGV